MACKFKEIIEGLSIKLAGRNIPPEISELLEQGKALLADENPDLGSNVLNITTKSGSGFQGYMRGFSTFGKGTPQGDGKDKAMREVADGFIGETADFNGRSSTNTSATEIELKIKDNFLDRLGDRTVSVYNDNPGSSDDIVVMLARNGKFNGRSLANETKNEILVSHENGSTFAVGDMPGVDTQFIEYLEEIGASYKVYTTNREGKEFNRRGNEGKKYRELLDKSSKIGNSEPSTKEEAQLSSGIIDLVKNEINKNCRG